MTILVPPDLAGICDYAFHDAIWIAGYPHSPDGWTILVVDEEGIEYTWRASLSLDDRWTLSPVSQSAG